MIENEAVKNLLAEFGIDAAHTSPALQSLAAADSRTIKDLKLNVSSVLGSANLNRKETALLALAVASNEKNAALMNAFEAMAKKEGADDAIVGETHACVAVMSANNIFYRFKHWMHDVEYYQTTPAGLRMSVMMNPAMGKEFFELMSLALSAVNGCERCVTSHEASVKQHGATEVRTYDAIRLAAVIRSLCVMV